MRRLEKVEGRRGPRPAAVAGGVKAGWEVWSMEPVIMQSCRVRLSVTVLSWAWRAQDKLKGRKSPLSLFLCPCFTLPAPNFSFSPPPLPQLPQGLAQVWRGQQASCRLLLGPGQARPAGLPCLWPELLAYPVISCVSGLNFSVGINYKNKRKSLNDLNCLHN